MVNMVCGASNKWTPFNAQCTHLEVRLDVLHVWLGVVAKEGVHAHHYARRAEATLRPVRLGNPLLNGVQFSP